MHKTCEKSFAFWISIHSLVNGVEVVSQQHGLVPQTARVQSVVLSGGRFGPSTELSSLKVTHASTSMLLFARDVFKIPKRVSDASNIASNPGGNNHSRKKEKSPPDEETNKGKHSPSA